MWDFPTSKPLANTISRIFQNNGVVAAVCHGPAGLLGATDSAGQPMIKGFRVNGFTNAEEDAVGLSAVVPFHLETEMKARGGVFEGAANFTAMAIRDRNIITGQNPMSSLKVAELVNAALSETQRAAA
jgi:putative intracellular protease/amidase